MCFFEVFLVSRHQFWMTQLMAVYYCCYLKLYVDSLTVLTDMSAWASGVSHSPPKVNICFFKIYKFAYSYWYSRVFASESLSPDVHTRLRCNCLAAVYRINSAFVSKDTVFPLFLRYGDVKKFFSSFIHRRYRVCKASKLPVVHSVQCGNAPSSVSRLFFIVVNFFFLFEV